MENNIRIRTVTPADAAELVEIYRPYVEHTAITFEYEVPSAEEFRGRIEHTLTRYPYICAVEGDTIVGYAYLSAFVGRAAYDWSAETSIYLREDIRGRGIGTLLYNELERICHAMGILNLNACIGSPRGEDPYLTDGSIRFHTALGYRMVGNFEMCGLKFDRWYDMCWMEKHIGEHRLPQPPIRSYSEVREELGL